MRILSFPDKFSQTNGGTMTLYSKRRLALCAMGGCIVLLLLYSFLTTPVTSSLNPIPMMQIARKFVQGTKLNKVLNLTSGAIYSPIRSLSVNARLENMHGSDVAKFGIHENFHIFNASNESDEDKNSINNNKCVPLATTKGKTPICVYDPKIDKWVSGSIVTGGMWDRNGVYLMASFLEQIPDMQVLDIGCNIGVFTLQAAKMGRKVLSVDANNFNLRLLSKSLKLGGLMQNVTLVSNAVSDAYEKIQLTITTGNIGGSYVTRPGETPSREVSPKFRTQTALTIKLDDLISLVKGTPLFIKMDIEGSEWRAFKGGEQFFEEVDVRYILMEWMSFKKVSNADEFARYISNFGFKPFEAKNSKLRKRLEIHAFRNWPGDVLWIKE